MFYIQNPYRIVIHDTLRQYIKECNNNYASKMILLGEKKKYDEIVKKYL